MTDEILRKFTGRSGIGLTTDPDIDSEGGTEDVGGSFGWIRSARDRCISLELRKRDGGIVAIAYGWIERLEFDPSEGITIHAHGQKIRIRGRNLNAEVGPQARLFEGICRHRVPWVRETDRTSLLKSEQASVVIEFIEW